ncbi:hypothetical protein CGC55_01525 [Capnocytophaga sputigena]|uniref:Uncharacterized protein n=1 Tax=Capnocytophaga sputigena TaxID=1019 RepID=A0ABN5BHN9_CAPSP|nr:hypothetical protein CGC55_01525 [Capnocytophaga sputigena]
MEIHFKKENLVACKCTSFFIYEANFLLSIFLLLITFSKKTPISFDKLSTDKCFFIIVKKIF